MTSFELLSARISRRIPTEWRLAPQAAAQRAANVRHSRHSRVPDPSANPTHIRSADPLASYRTLSVTSARSLCIVVDPTGMILYRSTSRGAPAAAGGGGEDGAVGQHRGRCAPAVDGGGEDVDDVEAPPMAGER